MVSHLYQNPMQLSSYDTLIVKRVLKLGGSLLVPGK
jgi:hypothetical protein